MHAEDSIGSRQVLAMHTMFLAAFVVLASLTVVLCGPCPYLKFSPEHTGCKSRNATCDVIMTGVTAADKAKILKLHNDYRSKIALGQEHRAGGMPSASNMLELIWDDELAAIAQKHTETCVYKHDCNDCRTVPRFYVGQNIGYAKYSPYTPGDEADYEDWEWLMEFFYEEVELFHKDKVNAYVSSPDITKPYGHFTQLIWAKSYKVGCGWTLYRDGTFVKSYMVCNYGEGGNIKLRPVYKVGPACSDCPKNTCCGRSCSASGITAKYPGLCKLINENLTPDGQPPRSRRAAALEI